MSENDIRVVIVDDDEEVLDMLGEAVSAFGFRAFTAKNAVQGLHEVREVFG